MKTGQKGLALIKSFEGLVLTAYKDPVGVWTIGYGHTAAAGSPKPSAGMKITAVEAADILSRDLGQYEAGVTKALRRVPSQDQFDAMVSLCFNIGPGAFGKSSVVRFFNDGNFDMAAASFLLWRKAGGKFLSGLVRRREAERQLFLEGSNVIPPPPDIPSPEPEQKPRGLLKALLNLIAAIFKR